MADERLPRPTLQFSLRLVFVCLTAVCLALGLFAGRVARQRAAVAEITHAGGRVTYGHKLVVGPHEYERADTFIPVWLRAIFGDDWFYRVEGVTLYSDGCNDEMLPHVAALPHVKRLALWAFARPPQDGPTGGGPYEYDYANRGGVTDDGLSVLRGHPSLEHLSMGGNRITDAAIEHFIEMPRLKTVDADECISSQGYASLMAALSARE